MRRASSGAGVSENSRIRMRALSGEVHSGHSATEEESEHGGSSSSPGQANPGTPGDDPSTMAFKCPKTKKVLQHCACTLLGFVVSCERYNSRCCYRWYSTIGVASAAS